MFIGIVTAAMVKNTGSQTAVSRGYGSAMVMNSTVSSGIVATEGFFLKNTDDKAKAILNNIVKQQAGDYVYGGSGQRRAISASSGQYFSSRIDGHIPPPGANNVKAGVVIDAGKNAKGRAERGARVFYEFGGFEFKVDVPPVTNAVFSKGRVADANMAMTVTKGTATFLGGVTFQNAKAVFDTTAYFEGNVEFPSSSSPTFNKPAYFVGTAKFQAAVTFNGAAYFNNEATFTSSATFNSDAYFGQKVTFQNGTVKFNGRAGFDGNIETNLTMSAPNDRDIYMNGNFTSNSSGKMVGANLASQVVYYSGTVTPATKSKFTSITQGSSTTGMTALNKLKGISAANAAIMTPPTTEKQTDPQLSLKPVYDAAANGGSVKILNAKDAMTSNGSTFDINKLTATYNNALADPSSLYLGKYMVIEVTSTIGFTSNSGTLDANIIYIVKDGGTLDAGGHFYSNTANATTSTLVYAGSGDAKLNQFGSSGHFRGFIYIDEDNCASNSITFTGSNSKLTGAIHNFSDCPGKPLVWNTGVANYSMPIDFNRDVLNDFGYLYAAKKGDGGNVDNGVTLKPTGIEVKPLGYYFY